MSGTFRPEAPPAGSHPNPPPPIKPVFKTGNADTGKSGNKNRSKKGRTNARMKNDRLFFIGYCLGVATAVGLAGILALIIFLGVVATW